MKDRWRRCIAMVMLSGCICCAAAGIARAARDGGYDVTGTLWAKAVLQVATTPVTPVTLVWKQVGEDTTPSGAKVVSGYFYADPADFAYGSQFNPEVFVKVYIDPSGWCNMAFNHVTVDPVTISSAHNYSGAADQTGSASTLNRLVEHQYSGVNTGSIVETSSIVGSWGTSPIDGDHFILTFFANGTYIFYRDGVEYGTYTHNNTTGEFSVNILRDEQEYGMADNGTPYPLKVFVEGDTISVYENDVLDTTLARVKSDTSPIVGGWAVPSEGDYVIATFYANGSYFVYHDGPEYGTYTHDNTTGAINATVIMDGNGGNGMADSGTPYQDKAFVDGDTLSVYENGVFEETLTRVK